MLYVDMEVRREMDGTYLVAIDPLHGIKYLIRCWRRTRVSEAERNEAERLLLVRSGRTKENVTFVWHE